MKSFSGALLFSLLLTACSAMDSRGPSSVSEGSDKAPRIQQIDMRLAQIANEDFLLERKYNETQKADHENFNQVIELRKKREDLKSQTSQLQQERSLLEKSLSFEMATKNWNGVEPLFVKPAPPSAGKKREIWAIDDLRGFEIQKNSGIAFSFDTRDFTDYRLELQNELPEGTPDMQGRLECNGGSIIVDSGILMFKSEKRVRSFDFTWSASSIKSQSVVVGFAPGVNECRLFMKPVSSATWTHQLNLASLETLVPSANQFNQYLEVCARPTGFVEQDPVSFFWQQDFNQVSCPRVYESLQMLRDPLKAFDVKIKGLTGAVVPPRAYSEKDPMVNLDFTKAPDLDFIWVSSLNFSADFYGSVLGRAIRYHADRGAQIRILVPDATTFKKDRVLLKQLQAGRPNVKVRFYRYYYSSGRDGGSIDNLHRVNHAKLLVGYSEKHPQNNFMVTGGRNIRDPYLFFDKPEYTRYPWLFNYARGERPFVYYDDFEVEVRGAQVIQPVLAQLMQLWNRDEESKIIRSTNLNVARAMTPAQVSEFYTQSKKQPLMKHVLSIPYADGQMLEKFYVQMLDSARKEILLTTPYFNPTKNISEAFGRAVKRGVKIQVLTGIQLNGDDVPALVEDANKEGINGHFKELDIYEWTGAKSVLHAKLIVIDQKLSFVSSVNVNHRSFLHDVESGVLILHEGTAEKLKKEVLGYFRDSQKLTQERKIKWFNGKLLDVFDSYF
jgi:cardiolipin synthase